MTHLHALLEWPRSVHIDAESGNFRRIEISSSVAQANRLARCRTQSRRRPAGLFALVCLVLVFGAVTAQESIACTGIIDACGVCDGDNSTCAGCDGIPNSGLVFDACGVCDGSNACVGCDGVPFSGLVFDACGVCDGTNACAGCDGVPFSGLVFDSCGVCDGTNACVGCDGVPFSGLVFDACGICDGDGTTCVAPVPVSGNGSIIALCLSVAGCCVWQLQRFRSRS